MTSDDLNVAFNEWLQNRGGEVVAEMARKAKIGTGIVELQYQDAFMAGARVMVEAQICEAKKRLAIVAP